MSDHIVSPQEAQERLQADRHALTEGEGDLLHTVATEPDRTRAAVVEALLHFADAYGDVDAAEIAQNIKNGADW